MAGFIILHKSVPDTCFVDLQRVMCLFYQWPYKWPYKIGIPVPRKHKRFSQSFWLSGDAALLLSPTPLPRRNHFLKPCLTSSSPTTGKSKNLEEITMSSPQRGMGTSASDNVEISDPCPEAREKLQEMCRHMWAPQWLGVDERGRHSHQ